MTELPADVLIEAMEWLDPVRVMQLRSACRMWREEAVKAIHTVGLIDDPAESPNAIRNALCLKPTAHRVGTEHDDPPKPRAEGWHGKFPSISFPRFHLLPNVRRAEGARLRAWRNRVYHHVTSPFRPVELMYSHVLDQDDAQAIADILAAWPRLEEAAIMASPPLQRMSMGWPIVNRMPNFTAGEFLRALNGRCPELRVLTFNRAPLPSTIVACPVTHDDTSLRAVASDRDRLDPEDAEAFHRGLALIPKLEVLDVSRTGHQSMGAAPLLIPCADVFSRLRVFIAPRCASPLPSRAATPRRRNAALTCAACPALRDRHKLLPVLLRHAPGLEELHVVCHMPSPNHYDLEDTNEPLIDALLDHGGLHVLTLHGAPRC